MNRPFEEAVREHGPTVVRVCRAVLGQGPDAEDAWSETFLAALKAWPTLEEDTNIEAWLVRVATRKAIDVTRARARHALPVAEVPEKGTTNTDPVEGDQAVWDAVARLPLRQRQAIASHYIGGLSHAQTAELVGSSADAVRRAAAAGMKTLRAIYLHR